MTNHYNEWLEKFNREIGIKASVILYGNTCDIMQNILDGGKYQSVLEVIISYIQKKGYKKIIKWDRVSGIDGNLSINIPEPDIKENDKTDDADSQSYDIDIEDNTQNDNNGRLKEMSEFFPYMLNIISNGNKETAFIIDYSDYLFGNAMALSEQERVYLTMLSKALKDSQSYNINSDDFDTLGSLVVIFTKSDETIPSSYYLNNAQVASVNVPLPARCDRARFISDCESCFFFDKDVFEDKIKKDNFIDSLDGFSLKEIAQLAKLSKQIFKESNEQLSPESLINLYKYGEKISPWEELSNKKIATISDTLKKRVKGQDFAIEKVKDVVIRAFTGFSGLQHSATQQKPKGTLFFAGPTGVGKTELAKSLAQFIFGDENACIRFDMSEYNHEHSDQRLVGAPPGYVGYEAGGQLTNAIKKRPFCVVLFDEIEKANGKILDKFLQILEDGRLTDGKGETVSFSQTFIIFTSNIGAENLSPDISAENCRAQYKKAVKEYFEEKLKRPELYNRIGSDNIVPFNFITSGQIFIDIAKAKFQPIKKFVKERYKADLVFDNEDAAFNLIAKLTDKSKGGRGLLNVIESTIITPLSSWIFNCDNDDGVMGRTIKINAPNLKDIKNDNASKFTFEFQ